MKIIHCSDIHLDSKMESNLPLKLADQRRFEIIRSFCDLVSYAKVARASVVIIAGDMFDEDRCSPTTLETVFDAILKAPEITFLYLQGNHGSANLLSSMVSSPSNFIQFGTTWASFDFKNVSIQGVELTRDNYKTIYGSYSPKPNMVNIVVLHGEPTTNPACGCVALPLLEGKSIDYLALGHRHSYRLGKLGDRGKWCYSGCLEGRGFDECGKKGFVELDISEDGKMKGRFIPTSRRVLHEVEVDISGFESHPEILEACRAAAKDIPSKDLVKFVLVGQVSTEANKDLSALRMSLEGDFYFSKVVDSTSLMIDPKSYENDASLRGEFIRVVMSAENISEEDKQLIVSYGLNALVGKRILL